MHRKEKFFQNSSFAPRDFQHQACQGKESMYDATYRGPIVMYKATYRARANTTAPMPCSASAPAPVPLSFSVYPFFFSPRQRLFLRAEPSSEDLGGRVSRTELRR